jgi:hypothetical protein
MSSVQPPNADELLQSPLVIDALENAWIDSKSPDENLRHEEGGWIYMDLTTGDLSIERSASGDGSSIDLSNPPTFPGKIVVGKFHTHPNPSSEGWTAGPSRGDRIVDARHGVPDLIRSDIGIHVSGPRLRRGGIAGGPGYPP